MADFKWPPIDSSGGTVNAIGTLDGGTPSSNGASISSGNLFLQSASATNPGLVNTTTQSFAGGKTFTTQISVLGAVSSAYITRLGTTAAQSVLSGAGQGALTVELQGNSSATTFIRGINFAVSAAASAFTCASAANISFGSISAGSGSTITRAYAIQLPTATTSGAGTVSNSAVMSDSTTFTGTYFLYSENTSTSLFSGVVNCSAGVRTKISTANTANPPTNAELVSAFGAAATVGSGFVGILNDNNAGTNEYICWSDGTNWFYSTGTKAV